MLVRGLNALDILISGDDDGARPDPEYLIRALSSLLLSDAVGPLNRAAYYLPADRTGVMHAHRVVVASLIERAPRAGAPSRHTIACPFGGSRRLS